MRDADIRPVIRILRREVRQWRIPVVGQVAQETRDPFWVLVSCVLSLRTQDRTTADASRRLRALVSTPQDMVRLPRKTLERAIYPVGFYKTKARHLQAMCRGLLLRFGGQVPDHLEDLLTLPGVGRKTANLVVTVGYGKPGICVDTHVHRISNRWGYVHTRTPEQTEAALRKKLPRRYWVSYNDLLVTFGQNLCTPISPHCSRCLISPYCARVGVKKSR